jgi:hypothetical protein
MYVALRGINALAALFGTSLLVLFVVLDLAITWPSFAALITLSGEYVGATSNAQQAEYVAAASYARAVLGSPLFAVYAILVPAIGILVLGLIMLRSMFGRTAACLGVLTGVLGIVAVVGPLFWSSLGVVAILTSVLTTVWVLLVGYRLLHRRNPVT